MKEKTIDALRSAAVKIWPKAVFPNLRKAIKDNLGRVSVQRRISEMADADLTFVEPWAFIRVKDERKTLLASLPKISGFGAVDDVGKRPISLWHKQTPGILGVDFYPDRLYNIL